MNNNEKGGLRDIMFGYAPSSLISNRLVASQDIPLPTYSYVAKNLQRINDRILKALDLLYNGHSPICVGPT